MTIQDQIQQSASADDTFRETKRILQAINRHLAEERCNHKLSDIIAEGLE